MRVVIANTLTVIVVLALLLVARVVGYRLGVGLHNQKGLIFPYLTTVGVVTVYLAYVLVPPRPMEPLAFMIPFLMVAGLSAEIGARRTIPTGTGDANDQLSHEDS